MVRKQKEPKLKLSDKAYELLKRDIVECVWRPGDIIEESVICAKYKIGHTPFREACARLNAEGWIEIVPHRGYFVAPISPTHIRDLFELRLLVEPRAAYLACSRVTPEGLALLERNVKQSIELAELRDVTKSLWNSIEFHRLIAFLSGNRELASLVETVHFKLMRGILFVLRETQNPVALNSHHQGILKAFQLRDPELAQQEMEKDLQETIEIVESNNSMASVARNNGALAGSGGR